MGKKVLKRGFCPIPELYQFYLRNTAKASIKRVRGGGMIVTIVEFPNGYSVEFWETVDCDGREIDCRIYDKSNLVDPRTLNPFPSLLSSFCTTSIFDKRMSLDPDQVERDCVSILSAVQWQGTQDVQDPTPERVISPITAEDIAALRRSYE